MNESGLELRSTISEDGVLTIDLAYAPVSEPADDEVVIRMEAAPLNPSDMALLTYPADLSSGRTTGSGADTVYTADVPAEMLAEVKARIGVPVPVGNEGSGTVVRAGRSAAAQALLGKTVAAIGGAMYCQYRRVNVAAVLPLGEGVSAKQGAACFVNPMTALAMTECMALEGYKGIVHTAAASNLGQILNRICMADGINLVNIVRKEDQAELLRQAGAKYVVNSSSDNFREELSAAIAATEAYVCFDAIGGGSVQDDILFAMESAATNGQGTIGPYGSDTFKQIYVYGGLNPEPTVLKRNYGFTWAVSGWLTSFLLRKIGAEKVSAMRSRVAAEIDTTFASFFHDEVSLAGALQAENIARFSKQSTGTKFLINPSME